MSTLRVIVISGADCGLVAPLLLRIEREVPDVRICGVLYQLPRPPKTFRRRLTNALSHLRDRGYVRYLAAMPMQCFATWLSRLGHGFLDFVHGCPRLPQRATRSGGEELAAACDAIRCQLHLTADVHSPAALTFVRDLDPDLGVVWGTRILKPDLFNLPRQGSVNIHRKKVPEYRGSGPAGLWELLDNRREIGITIHRVVAALDAGPVVDSGSFPIEPFDTLSTLDCKTHVAGNDLLIRFLNRAAAGDVVSKPQTGTAREFRKLSPHQLRSLVRQITAQRPPYRTDRRHSVAMLLLRSAGFMPYVLARNWIRRIRGAYPIVVLRQFVRGDEHGLGLPLDLLLRHLDFLRRHYRIESLSEASAMLRNGRVTAPTVALTFDGESNVSFTILRAALSETRDRVGLLVSPHRVAVKTTNAPAVNIERVLDWNQLADLWELELTLQGCLPVRASPVS